MSKDVFYREERWKKDFIGIKFVIDSRMCFNLYYLDEKWDLFSDANFVFQQPT